MLLEGERILGRFPAGNRRLTAGSARSGEAEAAERLPSEEGVFDAKQHKAGHDVPAAPSKAKERVKRGTRRRYLSR